MSPLPKDRNHGRSLRQMLACKKKCQVFQKLKAAMRKGGATEGLTRIEIPMDPAVLDPKQCTEWRMIDIPSKVLFHLQERNRRHSGKHMDLCLPSALWYRIWVSAAKPPREKLYSTVNINHPTPPSSQSFGYLLNISLGPSTRIPPWTKPRFR
jgi:hypothetical protein